MIDEMTSDFETTTMNDARRDTTNMTPDLETMNDAKLDKTIMTSDQIATGSATTSDALSGTTTMNATTPETTGATKRALPGIAQGPARGAMLLHLEEITDPYRSMRRSPYRDEHQEET